MENPTEQQTKAKSTYKKGDKLTLSYEGHPFSVTIKQTSVVGFFKEYYVEFEDGSCKWIKEHEFTYILN